MLKCPRCGNSILEDDAFCPNCGMRLSLPDSEKDQIAPTGSEKTIDSNGAKPQRQIPKPTQRRRSSKESEEKPTRSHRTLIIAVIATVVAIVALGFIAYITGFLSVIRVFAESSIRYVAFGSEGFWLIIAVVILVVSIMIWRSVAVRITRKARLKDYQREQELTNHVVSIETTIDKAQLQKALRKKMRLKYFFSKSSDPNVWQCHYPGKPLTAGRGDEFTANLYFDDSSENKTIIYAEFVRWREKNGVTRKRGLNAMQTFIDTIWSVVHGIDTSANMDTVKR